MEDEHGGGGKKGELEHFAFISIQRKFIAYVRMWLWRSEGREVEKEHLLKNNHG